MRTTPSWGGVPPGARLVGGISTACGIWLEGGTGAGGSLPVRMTPSWGGVPPGIGAIGGTFSIGTAGDAVTLSVWITSAWGGVPTGVLFSVWMGEPPACTSLLIWVSASTCAAVCAALAALEAAACRTWF